MPTYLSDSEVFGKTAQYLSEDEVFGGGQEPKRSVADVVSAGIGSVVEDVTGGISRHDKRRRAEMIARGNEATQAMLADSQASGTAAELQARADSIEAAKPSAAATLASRGLDFTRDTAVSGAQGVIGLGESVVGLGDLATGWTGATPGGALKHVGYDPAAAKKALGDLKSDAGKERDAIYESTRGFTETLLTLGTNPGMLADKIAESMAGTIGAGAVGAKFVAKYMPQAMEAAAAAGLTGAAAETFIADKIAKVAIGSAAAAEGAQQAGNLAETARQADVPWKQYVVPAVASGVGTGLIAAASGGVAKRLGVGDIEADIALRGTRGSVKTDPGFVLNRAAIEAAKEGGLEEMPQSMQEAAWENIAMGRPWDEGLGKAAATGLATGAGMGGGHAAFSRTGKDSDAPASVPGDPGAGYIPADEVLGAETEADKALYTPKPITALDRVAELDAQLNELHPQAAAGDQEAANEWNRLQAERRTLTAGWPAATPGAQISFSTETGSRLEGQYALMEAGDLTTSHDENLRPVATYPAELQPRERERHASELQVQQIVQKLDPARLGESADVATGAPIVGADGLVESGNARTIALKRVYQANGQKADDYRGFIKANAERFGITPESVDAMQRPVLVRVRTTPVNRAEFARQANAATVARMSPSEQARADAAAIDSLEDLNPDESGDFMSGSSTPFVRRFLAKQPTTEQAALIDASGRLSQAGYSRIRNAVLAKAYGDSPVLLRMVESMDDSTRNVTKALIRVAPQVAKTREAIGEGALHDADMTPDLLAAVEELASLKEKGVTVEQALAQAGMFGDKLTPYERDLLAFLNDNIRSPRRIADFIQRYLEALEAAGNPNQGSLLGDATAPAKGDLLAAAKRGDDGIEEDAGRRQPAESGGAAEEDGSQPKDAQGSGGGARGDEAAGGQAGGVDARAAQDFQDALADLGAIVRDYANVARVVPENTPGLMDTLVRLFDAAMRLGYNDAKKAVAYVKEQLRADDRFKSVWNKIQAATYQKAAKQAADEALRRDENPIKVNEALTGRAAEIQTTFRDWVWNNLDEAIAQYQAANGNVLNTDEARKLSPDYVATPETRSLYSAAVHEPASWLTKEIYRRELEKPAPAGKDDLVLFTAGGTGAGKSSAVKAASRGDVERAQIVFDTNMNGYASSAQKIEQALAAGKRVAVVYVYRDPLDALVNGALARAMNPESESYGRTVPLNEHVKTHVGSAEAIRDLREKFADDARVSFVGIDNSQGKGGAREVPLESLPRPSYNDIELEAYHEAVRREHQASRISDAVLVGTLGAQALSQANDGQRVQGTGQPDSATNGRRSERDLIRTAGQEPAAVDARPEDADGNRPGSVAARAERSGPDGGDAAGNEGGDGAAREPAGVVAAESPANPTRSAVEVIREVAEARPFDAYESVRDEALDRLVEETGKRLGEHDELRGSMMRDPLAEAIHEGQYRGMVAYAKTLPVRISDSAISAQEATSAYSGTSHSPEQRGASARRGLFRDLMGLWRQMEAAYNAAAPDRQADFVAAFNETADRYTGMVRASLSAHGRVMSPMIAGPAKFPVESNRKKSDAAMKRSQEAGDFLRKAPARLAKVLRGAVDNSIASQLAEAEQKLAEREKDQSTMKSANAALRKGDDKALAALGFDEARISELKKPDFAGRKGFPDYRLTNNNAEIKRLRLRVEDLRARADEAGAETEEDQEIAAGVRMVRNAETNRLQLFFDEKPGEEVRSDLRGSGFKWAPSVSAWQRQLTANAIADAERIVAKHYPGDQQSVQEQEETAGDAGAPQTETPAFKAWFGDSKVVDSEGKPLVVYHGTTADFAAFDVKESFDGGFHFGSIGAAEKRLEYWIDGADETAAPNVRPHYLAIQNPKVLVADLYDEESWAEAIHAAKQNGYDGIRYPNSVEGGESWIAFLPAQIKSAIGNRGTFDPAETDTRLNRMERALFAGRMRVEDVRAVVEGFRKVAKNLPTVHVLQDTKDAPRAVQKWLRENDAMHDAAGLFHDGEIYLFASHLADIAHAQRVFLHEAQHYGLSGLFGTALDEAMLYLYEHNGTLKVKTDARQKADRTMSTVRAVEEVIADMASDAKKLTGWKRLVAAVRDILRKAGWVENVTDNDVAYLIHRAGLYWKRAQKTGYANVKRGRLMRLADDLAEQEKWLAKEAKARGYASIDELAEKDYPAFENLAALWRQKHPVKEAMLSRAATATPNLTTEQQAEAVIQQKAATPKPLETTLRAVTQATKLDKLTTAAYSKAAELLDRYTPETIKAGIVSDYGIPEAVLDRRAVTEGRQRKQLRAAGTLLEKLATLTRAESRVAYAWMNNDDPQAAAHFEEQLPPESLATMREVRSLIDKLSQEAVKLGQLDPEAFKRNRFAYLHRSYVKHTAELSQGETKSRARAISILGDQYKGRGMTDAADMARIKNVAPEWWGRKLKAGQADKGLKGEQFIRLERRAPTGAGTQPLPGIGDRGKGRLLEVAYWPAAEPLPARYGAWDRVGTWEVRGTKGAKLILWRDFTAQERQALGEIDEVRFAIAKTLHAMIHDVETGRYLEWLAQTYAKKEGEEIDGTVVEASERLRDTFKPGEWVKVPEAEIPGTKVKKYGVLAGRYLPGPIWNDVRQMGGNFKPLGETYSAILRAWKSSKTALSPAVHMNNVMANFVMADWHDVTAGHVAKALRLMLSKDEVAAEVLARYGESGGTIGTWATKELQQEQLKPMLEALEKELGIAGSVTGQVGVMSALQLALRGQFPAAWDAFKPSKTGQVPVKAARAMIALYEAEDQVFRLAAWLKAKEEGATDLVAGKAARKSFLDYSINAPWVQMMRSTAFPFIAFTYRSVPMLLETAAKKPWKLLKLGMVAGALNWLGYALSGGDEDDERKLLPEEKAGMVLGFRTDLFGALDRPVDVGVAPKLIRMPWNDEHGSPVFLDIRRWVPAGDVFDTGQTHAVLPILPPMQIGGPLALLGELNSNKSNFTGKAITLETDTPAEKAEKFADYLFKAFAPNLLLPNPVGYVGEALGADKGFMQTYAWTGASNAGTGRTDSFGREQSLAQAVISSVGVKVGGYPKDVLQLNAQREAQAKDMEIERNLTGLKREYQRNGITAAELQEKAAAQMAKKRKVVEDLQKRISGQ